MRVLLIFKLRSMISIGGAIVSSDVWGKGMRYFIRSWLDFCVFDEDGAG